MLVDVSRNLDDGGRIWVLHPGAGKPGALESGLVSESAQIVGMVQTKAALLGQWQGSCLVSRGAK
ncbi:Protein of uncharacterised function (DUF3052) [Corynebacterium kutscheri]|nr:Protein of uncharacterised function (DUF3052) [Corynebacterium kutscheri]